MEGSELKGMDELTLLCAFSYVLERKSYVVDHVASLIERNADQLSDSTRKAIVRDLDEALIVRDVDAPRTAAQSNSERWGKVLGRLGDNKVEG